MKYMSDPFPARRDQHAFQIASRTFFTRGRQTRWKPSCWARTLATSRVNEFRVLQIAFRLNITQLWSESTVPVCSRSCLTEGNPPPLLINYWRRRRRRQQQLSNNIELAVASMCAAVAGRTDGAAAARVHAPFGLNYRHALNRGEAATSTAETRPREQAAGKNGNEAAALPSLPPPPQPSPPRWLSARLGPDTGMKFLRKMRACSTEMAKTDITLITVGIHGQAVGPPAGLLCIGLKPSLRGGGGKGGGSGVVVASCHQKYFKNP